MASKLFDQLDNQEIDSYTTGDYASHGEQMLHCWYVPKEMIEQKIMWNNHLQMSQKSQE